MILIGPMWSTALGFHSVTVCSKMTYSDYFIRVLDKFSLISILTVMKNAFTPHIKNSFRQ